MKFKWFTFAFVIFLSAFFFFGKAIDFTGMQGLSSNVSDSNKITSKQLRSISYNSDNFICSEENKEKVGFAYQYERKSKDLLRGDEVLGTEYRKEEPILGVLFAEDNSSKTKFRILDNGLASLYARLDLISRAKESIELEYFIYRIRENKNLNKIISIKDFLSGEKISYTNKSTVLITQALMEKAVSGVKVRVLIDASGTILDFKEDLYTASHIKLRKMAEAENVKYDEIKNNFKFKYYNNVPTRRISTVNYRNHRKLFMVDGMYGITGGRNIEDKYFDMDPYYNFHDRDVLITSEDAANGPILKAMKNSFDYFWARKDTSVEISFLDGVNPARITDESIKSNKLLAEPIRLMNSDFSETKKEIMLKGENNYNISTKERACKKATYVSDRPILNSRRVHYFLRANSLLNGKLYKERYRFTGRLIEEKIETTMAKEDDKSIVISSPYFSLNCRGEMLAERLSNLGVKASIFTNSLTSTDAVYNASLFYERAPGFINDRAAVYVHSSKGLAKKGFQYMKVKDARSGEEYSALDSRWGLHSKSHIYGKSAVYIGTYNVDNRSSFYNAEMGVFCEDTPEIAQELLDLTLQRARGESGYGVLLVDGGLVGQSVAGTPAVSSVANAYGEGATKGEIDFMKDIFGLVETVEILF